MNVCYVTPYGEEAVAILRHKLGSRLRLATGRPAPPDSDILIEGRPTRADLEASPRLRAVIVPFAGVPRETLDLLRGIPRVTLHNLHHNAPDTAEAAFALLLAAAKRVVPMDRSLRRHDWRPRYDPGGTMLLSGKTALVLGYGEIGRRVARLCRAAGMNVLAARRRGPALLSLGVHVYPIDVIRDLLPVADALVLCLPQTPLTERLIGDRELSLLPEGAILVNVARAEIVEEEALFRALQSGRLHSAGLDVWYRYPSPDPYGDGDPENEESDAGSGAAHSSGGKGAAAVTSYFGAPDAAANTPPSRFPFHELENVVLSPHRGGATRDSERNRAEHLARLLRAALKGRPIPNRVDLDQGY
jgi:phosphoglycerate dehydrogenase-like enzyme